MDPDKTLEEAVAAAGKDNVACARHLCALTQWIVNGGFVPDGIESSLNAIDAALDLRGTRDFKVTVRFRSHNDCRQFMDVLSDGDVAPVDVSERYRFDAAEFTVAARNRDDAHDVLNDALGYPQIEGRPFTIITVEDV
jgi:hypothetical protein